MTKRRINQQQRIRIDAAQARHQIEPSVDEPTNTQEGLVITRFSRHALIETSDLTRVHCAIRPNLDPLVAGDWVKWQPIADDQGIIVSCNPRRSVLTRSTRHEGAKPIVANMSQLMIVVAPKPELSWLLLDSYLLLAEDQQLNACLVLNKIDLPCAQIQQILRQWYEPLGYPVLFTQEDNPAGDSALHAQLNHQISVFLGQSGVGKSSLIARLLPHETRIQTGALSERTQLGCHTTTNACFYHLPQGGALIDSPGVRTLHMDSFPRGQVLRGFREFRGLAQQCRFRNCNHVDAPDCAIRQAVACGKASRSRYTNLIKMLG